MCWGWNRVEKMNTWCLNVWDNEKRRKWWWPDMMMSEAACGCYHVTDNDGLFVRLFLWCLSVEYDNVGSIISHIFFSHYLILIHSNKTAQEKRYKKRMCFFLSSWDSNFGLSAKNKKMDLLRSESAINKVPLQLILIVFLSLCANQFIYFAGLRFEMVMAGFENTLIVPPIKCVLFRPKLCT